MHLWLLSSVALADPTPIPDHAALSEALASGARVRAVIRYGQCLHHSEPGPDVIRGLELSDFEAFSRGAIGNPAGFISASQQRLSLHPEHGPAHELTRLKVYDDARVELTIRYLEPRRLRLVEEEVFGCSLTPSGGLSLFADPTPSAP